MRLRHPNGRGFLLDDAEANRATYISRDSSASGSAKLRDCALFEGSQVAGSAQVYGGRYYASSVIGGTVCAGSPLVRRSLFICSEVSGTPAIDHVHAVGTTEICDSPNLIGMTDPLCLNNAIVYGSPTIIGSFTITGRVHEGTWTRAPRHIKLPWCDLSECIDGKVILDCRCRSVSYWARHGAKLARRWNWSEDQISVTLDTIQREFASFAGFADGATPFASLDKIGDWRVS